MIGAGLVIKKEIRFGRVGGLTVSSTTGYASQLGRSLKNEYEHIAEVVHCYASLRVEPKP